MKRKTFRVRYGGRAVKTVKGMKTKRFRSHRNYRKFILSLKRRQYGYDRHLRKWVRLKPEIAKLKKEISKEQEELRELEAEEQPKVKGIYTEFVLPSNLILGLGSHKYQELFNTEFYVPGELTGEDFMAAIKNIKGSLIVNGEYLSIKDVNISHVDSLRGDEQVYPTIEEGLIASLTPIKTWIAKYANWRERKKQNEQRKLDESEDKRDNT